jgi:ABC-type multidrug transport system permease subunit
LGIAFRSKPADPVQVGVLAGPGAAEVREALRQAPDVRAVVLEEEEARAALRVGRVSMVVEPGSPRTYVYDPARPESRLARLVADDTLERAAGRVDTGERQDRTVSQPGSRYVDFLVPGLLGLNIMSAGMWGIGYAIVETRTRKLLKRMVATPMKRSHFLLSFVAMRVVMLALELPILMGFAWLVFGVVIQGSVALFTALAVLGALCFSGLGLLVAARARNTETVGGLMNLVMMPMFIGSGVFFSVSNFPESLQPFLRLLPLTALNDALRAVVNQGASLPAVAGPVAVMVVLTVVCFGVALRVFRWT